MPKNETSYNTLDIKILALQRDCALKQGLSLIIDGSESLVYIYIYNVDRIPGIYINIYADR